VKKANIFRIIGGIFFFSLGFILWKWSKQWLWVLIYPPPIAKQFIEKMSLILCILGVLLVFDGVRRVALEERVNS
jgi:hypothetical protein